jgi:hypothetical protein
MDIKLMPLDRFLTLVSTRVIMNGYDWVIFAKPVIVLE